MRPFWASPYGSTFEKPGSLARRWESTMRTPSRISKPIGTCRRYTGWKSPERRGALFLGATTHRHTHPLSLVQLFEWNTPFSNVGANEQRSERIATQQQLLLWRIAGLFRIPSPRTSIPSHQPARLVHVPSKHHLINHHLRTWKRRR